MPSQNVDAPNTPQSQSNSQRRADSSCIKKQSDKPKLDQDKIDPQIEVVKEEEKKMPELKKLNKSISSGSKYNDSYAGVNNVQGPDNSFKNDREIDIAEPKFINSNENLENMNNIVEGPGPDAKEPVVQEGIKEEAKD